jgi:hypothetical protein
LPLIIFWKAATGQPQVSADFGFAISSPPMRWRRSGYEQARTSPYYHFCPYLRFRSNAQQRDFFKHYTEKTRQVAGGEVTVTPIELIAETSPQS